MLCTIRQVGINGVIRYTRFRAQYREIGIEKQWYVYGRLFGLKDSWIEVIRCPNEEEALLAVLTLKDGGSWKVLNNVLTDDLQLPRTHRND